MEFEDVQPINGMRTVRAKLPRGYEEAARGSIVAYMLQIGQIDNILEYDKEGLRLAIAAVRESGRTVGEIFDAPGEDMILEAFQLLRSNREESIKVLQDAIAGYTPEEAKRRRFMAMHDQRRREEVAIETFGVDSPEAREEIERGKARRASGYAEDMAADSGLNPEDNADLFEEAEAIDTLEEAEAIGNQGILKAIDAQAMAENRKIAAYPEGCRNCGAIVPFLFRNGLCANCCNAEGATE